MGEGEKEPEDSWKAESGAKNRPLSMESRRGNGTLYLAGEHS